MDDRKSLIERVVGATEETVTRVQHEVTNSAVLSATRERASAARTKAQQAALNQLQLATRDDIAALQASLDRIEAAVSDLAKRLPKAEQRPRAKPKPPE
jgi:hypothetical protein